MTFAHPLTLLLIPLVAAGTCWIFRGRSPAALRSLGRVRRLWADRRGLTPQAPVGHRRARGLFFAAAGVLAVAALARPQWGRIEEVRYQHAREVMVALDVSRSMLADDVTPNRLDRARLLIESVADELRGDRLGLLPFAGTAFVQVPLSADTEVLRALLPQVDPTYIPQGGTRYGRMLETAAAAFSTGPGQRYLLILSDGEALDDSWKTALPALQERGIRVVALGIGTHAGALVPAPGGGATKDASGAAIVSRLEPATLESLAAATGGTYRDAASWVDVPALIRETVARGERGAFVETRTARVPDRFQWFLAPAVLCALLSLWLEFPIGHTPVRSLRRAPLAAPASAVAALLLTTALWASPRSASAAGGVSPERQGRAALPPADSTLSPLPDRQSQQAVLEAAVTAAAAKPVARAQDYAQLATATIAYATAAPHDPKADSLRSATIADALAGIALGEHIDPQATDWAGLRRQLQALLAQPPPEEPQPDKQQAQQDNDESAGADQSSNAGSPADDSESGANAGGASDGETQAKQADESAGSPAASGATSSDEQSAGSPTYASHDSASAGSEVKEHAPGAEKAGDTSARTEGTGSAGQNSPDDDRESPAQQTEADANAPSKARPVGGGTVRDPATTGVAMRAADKLAALRRADAPAVLFDRMKEAAGAAPVQPTERDW